MAFENITIFEPHFENVRFGPGSPVSDEHEDREDDPVVDNEGGRGKLAPVLASLALVIAVTVLARRRFGGDGEIDVETVDVEEPVETAAE